MCSPSPTRACWATSSGSALDRRLSQYASVEARQTRHMATYIVNPAGVAKARELIDTRQYRVRSRWADVQPRAAEQNEFLANHGWDEYGSWHLGLTEGPADDTKARYAFVFGDFRRLHRMGLIACYYRAAEWEHRDVMVAAHDLLLHLDETRSKKR